MVYVDHVESSQLIRYSGGVGEHRPLYCSASGLAFLSFLPGSDKRNTCAR